MVGHGIENVEELAKEAGETVADFTHKAMDYMKDAIKNKRVQECLKHAAVTFGKSAIKQAVPVPLPFLAEAEDQSYVQADESELTWFFTEFMEEFNFSELATEFIDVIDQSATI